jgi:hypothetical protein
LKLKLRTDGLNYLLFGSFISLEFRKRLTFIANKIGYSAFLDLTEEDANYLRDACSEQLQRVGFDKDYELTNEGRILEDLIDKSFTE